MTMVSKSRVVSRLSRSTVRKQTSHFVVMMFSHFKNYFGFFPLVVDSTCCIGNEICDNVGKQ